MFRLSGTSGAGRQSTPLLPPGTVSQLGYVSRMLSILDTPCRGWRTWQGPGRSPSSLKPCGYRKESMPWPFFLNRMTWRFQYARLSGLCDQVPEKSVGRKSYRNTPGSVIPGQPKGMMFFAVRATLPLPAAVRRSPLSGAMSHSSRRRSNSVPPAAPT